MTAIEFENISKQYRLGLASTGTLSHDLNRLWTPKASIAGRDSAHSQKTFSGRFPGRLGSGRRGIKSSPHVTILESVLSKVEGSEGRAPLTSGPPNDFAASVPNAIQL